ARPPGLPLVGGFAAEGLGRRLALRRVAWSRGPRLDGCDEPIGPIAVDAVDTHLQQRADVMHLLGVPRERAHVEAVVERDESRRPFAVMEVDGVDAVR